MNSRGISRRNFLKSAAVGMTAAQVFALPGVSRLFAQDVVNIRKMAWGSPLEKANIEAGLANFMAENPGIAVEYIHTPERYDEVLQTMIAGGTAPDVFKIGAPYPDLAVRGVMMDITERVANDPVLGNPEYFFPFETQRSTLNGVWYGIGSTFQWRLLYCNTDLLAAAGIEPPSTDPQEAWTWEEFLDITTQLTIDAAGKHPGEEGFDVQNVQQWGFFSPDAYYDNFVYSNGGTIIDNDTLQYALDTPEAIEAVQAFADLRLVHNVAAQATVLEQMGMNSWQLLASGRVAIIVDGNWALQDIAKMGFNFSVGVLPILKQPATFASSSWTSVYGATQYPEESWELLRYLNSDEYQVGLVRAGLWGVSHRSLLTPEGVETWWNPEVHPENWLPLETAYKQEFGHVMPNVVGAQRTLGMITQSMAPIWIGGRSAQDVLTELNPQLNQTLADEQARI